VKKVPDVPVQMIKAFARKRRIVGGFRQDEPALENGLRVTSEAFGRPVAAYASRLPRRFDVGLQRCGMAEDAAATGIANLRRTRIDLLRQRADEARELRDLADDDRLAERDIGKHALKRIGRLAIGSRLEEIRGRLRPELGCGDAQRPSCETVTSGC